MNIPGYFHHLAEQLRWVKDRRYYLGMELGREVSRDEVLKDFMSRREEGLTLEERFNICYFNEFVVPAVVTNSVAPEDRAWVDVKAADLHGRGLSQHINFEYTEAMRRAA